MLLELASWRSVMVHSEACVGECIRRGLRVFWSLGGPIPKWLTGKEPFRSRTTRALCCMNLYKKE